MKKIIPFLFAAFLFTAPKSSYSQNPKLVVTDLSTLTLNVGNVDEFVYQIKNNGAAGSRIDSIMFKTIRNPNTSFYPLAGNQFYLTWPHANGPALYYNKYTYPHYPPIPANSYTLASGNNYITATMLTSLRHIGYLAQDSVIYLHIPFTVINCDDSTGGVHFYRDTAGHYRDTNNISSPVSVNAGNPILVGTVNVFDSASFCPFVHKDTAEVGFTVKNNDPTGGLPEPPYADSIRLYMYCTSSVASIDTNSFRINGVAISHTYITRYISGLYTMYLIDLTKYPAGVNGHPFGKNTINDISGSGWADELAQDSSLEVTATILYDTVGCPPYGNCTSTNWYLPNLAATWNNQCNSLHYVHNKRMSPDSSMFANPPIYQYSATAGASTMTAPSDVTNSNPDFNVAICPNYEQFWIPYGFKFDCPHPDYQLVMPLPKGYHLDTLSPKVTAISEIANAFHSDIYKYTSWIKINPYLGCTGAHDSVEPTVEEFFTPTHYLVMNFGKMPLSNCTGGTAYVPSCFNVPLELSCSDFSVHNINQENDTLSYKFEYICDTAGCANCGDAIACANTSTYHHCAGTCSSPPITYQGWIFERTNFGDSNLSYPSHYYNTCGASLGIVPSGSRIVHDSLYLDTAAAYPGDQVQALINGGFDSIPYKFSNVYLQIRYAPLIGAVGSPYYLYERDPDKQSYFIITGCTHIPALNGVHLPLPHCSPSNRSCGDVYSGTVQMNYSLLDAIDSASPSWYSQFIADSVNEHLTISSHIYLRVRNDGNFLLSPYFLSNGKHLVNVRAEYMAKYLISGDTAHSCDSWGNSMTLLQPSPNITLGEPTAVSNCDTFKINFLFQSPGALVGADDFPNEFRPFAELDSVVKITIPAKYTYTGTQFYTYIDSFNVSRTDNHFAGGATRKYFAAIPVVTHPGGKTLLTYTGLNNSCWPLIDQKQPNTPENQGYNFTISTVPSCSAGGPDTITAIAGYRVGTQQTDTNYMVHIKNATLREIITHSNPSISLNLPATVSDYSDLLSFRFSFCSTNQYQATVPWIAIENVAGYLVNIKDVTVRDSTLHETFSITNGGHTYYNGGDSGIILNLGSIGGDSCHILTVYALVDSNSRACPAPDSGKMVVRFGNICSGVLTNPDSAHCQNQVDTFRYDLFPTTLQLFQNGYTPYTCLNGGLLVDSLVIQSANLGTIDSPKFYVYPPAGAVVDSVKYTYPCDTVTFKPHPPTLPNHKPAADYTYYNATTGAIEFYGWNLNHDLGIHGLPGTLVTPSSDSNTMCVKVYMTMSCSYDDKDSTKFMVTGYSACHKLLKDSVWLNPKVNDTCCVEACTEVAGPFDLVIKNKSARLLYNGPITYNCQNILVEGTYIVNENVTFSNCNIAFAPHALIDIDSNHTLIVNNSTSCSHHSQCSHLYAACDTMWRGIFVEPGSQFQMYGNALLEDADTAIYAENSVSSQGTYQLEKVVLNKNYKDIVVRPCAATYTGTADQNIFTCRDFSSITACDWWQDYHSAPATTLKPPFSGQITSIGWQIDTVKHFEENTRWKAVTGQNCFDNLVRGIVGYSSNIVICMDTFQNFTSAINPAISVTGDTNHPDTLLIGGPSTQANIFTNCTRGIVAQNGFSHINIIYNRFKDAVSSAGVAAINVSGMNVTGSTLNIEKDSITNFSSGILSSLNIHVAANIIYNTITDTICSTNTVGIAVQESGSATASYTIDANTMHVFNDGISVNDVYTNSIVSNTITLGNRTHGNGCASTNYTGFGISATGCLGSTTIGCNTVIAPSTVVINPNAYKGIVEKQSTSVGVEHDSTVLTHYHILFNGTPFSGDNLWFNAINGVTGDTGIYNKGSILTSFGGHNDATNNTFYGTLTCVTVNAPSPNYFITGGAYTPPLPNCPAVTTTTTSKIAHNCPSVPSAIITATARVIGDDNLDTVGVDSVTLAVMVNTALSKVIFDANQDTNMALAKFGVLNELWQHPYLLSNNVLGHFNDSMSNSALGKIMAIDTAMSSENKNVNYLSLLNTLNGVNPHNNIEKYMQIATQGYLDYRINGTISINELTNLRKVANMCPDFNGQGVYLARSLVSLYDTAFVVYSDDCSGSDNERIISTTKDVPTNFNLYPNPNNGGFIVEYTLQQGQTGELSIYSMLGQKEAGYTLNAVRNKMNITNDYLSTGMHLYVIRVNNNEVKRDKLIIIK